MKLRIGNYIDKKMKEKEITKKDLYEKVKSNFHPEEDYVKYKGFTSRFYGKLYAEDLIEISYILGIDLNEMRDSLIHKNVHNSIEKVNDALLKSKYTELSNNHFSRWSVVEDGYVYIVWFRPEEIDVLDIRVEMYDIKEDVMWDITYLTYLAVVKLDVDWNNKSFEEKMYSIKKLNKLFFDKNNC